MAKGLPKEGELVIATIKKIFPYGAFCSLDEYDNAEAFLHVSEIAPRWIKNIHEHIKEGQKVIAKVHRYVQEKNQVDLTLKRVAENERVWKREQYRRANRGQKLLEIAAKKLKKDKAKFAEEIAKELEENFGSVYSAFEALSFDTEKARAKLDKIPEKTLKVLESIAKENIKKQKISISRNIKLECFEPDGVKKIKEAIGSLKSSKVALSVKYIGAPIYRIDIECDDYKKAEKEMNALIDSIRQAMGKC
ncbi:MAG: translation initiation factor IF-2 subunit alpha, partial [Candidatus Micrarchaeota archaeon]|nr:translation initiation factor IF-2 subunit alpha [Candidatus Micrarchaeota archaeon]